MNSKYGFTLIELIVSLGIFAILSSIVFVAINPGKQIEVSENQKRKSNVVQILNAVNQYMIENDGNTPAGITTTPTELGDFPGMTNICSFVIPQYIAAIPQDTDKGNGLNEEECLASGTSTYQTDYEISVVDSRVTVSSIDDPTISVNR